MGGTRVEAGARVRRPAGVAAGLPLLVLALLAAACSVEPSIGQAPQEGEAARAIGPFGVLVGDCYNDPVGTTEEWVDVEEVRLVPCGEPHDLEVIQAFELPDGSFPGLDTIREMVDERCIPTFDELVGRPFAESELSIQILAPSEGTWPRGDREVVCSVFALDGSKLVGSVRGSGR
jgi:hypothetical protein